MIGGNGVTAFIRTSQSPQKFNHGKLDDTETGFGGSTMEGESKMKSPIAGFHQLHEESQAGASTD
jgi:hypothetical protein